MTHPWTACPSYTVDLDQPIERRFAVVDPALIARARELLDALRAEAPPAATRLVPLVNLRTGFRFRREAKEIGRLGGYDWRWVLLANVAYDLALSTMACSTVALATPDGPVVARNMDWCPEHKLAAASCTMRFVRGGRPAFTIAGWPGAMGVVTGMSSRGFAVVLNAALSAQARSNIGYPVLLFLRTLLEDAAGFDEAVEVLSRKKLFTSGLFTLVGTENRQRVCIERTPSRARLRWAEGDRPLVTTNSYIAFSDASRACGDDRARPRFPTSMARYGDLHRLVADIPAAGRGDSDALLRALSHEGIAQDNTAQQVIMQPSRERIELYVPTRLLAAEAQPALSAAAMSATPV